MSDRIDQLPRTKEQPSVLDSKIMNDLFKQPSPSQKMNWNYILVLSLLFVVLSLPIVNNLLKQIVSESETVILLIKTVVFVVILSILRFMN